MQQADRHLPFIGDVKGTHRDSQFTLSRTDSVTNEHR